MSELQGSPVENEMSCEEFQDRLPEVFEGGKTDADTEHLRTCENCSALVRDLEYIAEAVRMLWPIQDPSPEVWKKIEHSIHDEAARPAVNPAPEIPEAMVNPETNRPRIIKELPPTGRVR